MLFCFSQWSKTWQSRKKPRYAVLRHYNEKEIKPSVEMGTIHVMSYNNNVLSHFYQDDFLESHPQGHCEERSYEAI